MKKPLAICALALLAVALYAQDAPGAPAGAGSAGGVSMLDVKAYAGYFGFQDGNIKTTSRYVTSAPIEAKIQFAPLSGREVLVDTPLEFALLSYYFPITIEDASVRVNAESVLPANDPRTAGLKLGAAVLKELTELRFLDPQNTAAIARYEGMLQFISDKNGVSRAEIDTYYRQGISGLIAGAVDEEFGKVSFLLKNTSTSHNAVLSYSVKEKQYLLSYSGAYTKNETRILTATSIEALLAEMRRNRTDFDETGIKAVNDNAALIPALVYADWQRRGVANGIDALGLVKGDITSFYLNPGKSTYEALAGIYARYYFNGGLAFGSFAETASTSYYRSVALLSIELGKKIYDDVSKDQRGTMARIPADSKYNVFSTPYPAGH